MAKWSFLRNNNNLNGNHKIPSSAHTIIDGTHSKYITHEMSVAIPVDR